VVKAVEQSVQVVFELIRDCLGVVLRLAADVVLDARLRVGVAGGGDGRRGGRHGHGGRPPDVPLDHLGVGRVVFGGGRHSRLPPQQLVFDTIYHVINTVQIGVVEVLGEPPPALGQLFAACLVRDLEVHQPTRHQDRLIHHVHSLDKLLHGAQDALCRELGLLVAGYAAQTVPASKRHLSVHDSFPLLADGRRMGGRKGFPRNTFCRLLCLLLINNAILFSFKMASGNFYFYAGVSKKCNKS